MSSYQFLHLSQVNGVWTIHLKRPEVFNALNAGLIHEIRDVAEKAKASESARVLVITGEGKAFCSGADLKSGASDSDLGAVLRATYNPMILALRGLDKPVIGAINGPAAGAGCSLALACDYLIAKEGAYFSELFVQIGLTLDAGSTAFLMQSVGYHKAFELAATAKKIGADEAKDLGFVAEVISEESWESRLQTIGAEFASKPTMAIALIKRELQKAHHQDLATVLEMEAEAQRQAGYSKDFQEGVASFLEKRAPQFRGK
ncbi:enoyl-CoA hydratase/isomerase family protein [Aquirufa aurantiipilula]|uniref:enoyl-CoA hydratase/isomerase family protein n=1 Tax=Aquirufa aurantiipilula TaxID=2696561 RepID=UPI001CAA72FF|nr:enoyl-CoA hydratase-related protein [Aquirufa aurantiipilula]MBZ1327521.1 2-(1,2-epoxy-1,2-dihydrophenyl)acetyl-CoA isomerase [Aquirufa aurantiipilula]